MEKRYIRKDSSLVWVNITCSTLRETSGATQFGITVIQDISERKQTEEALRLSEERFSKVFHASPIAITISRYDDGRYVDVNESCAQLFGYRREEMIGHTAEELGVRRDMSERVKVLGILNEQDGIRQREAEFYTRNGEVRHAVFSLEPIELGGERHLLTVTLDDTERKQMEESLRARETRYRTLMEQASDAIFVADSQANYVDINTALLRLSVRDVVSPDDLAVTPIPWEAMRAGTVILERRLVRKDGVRVPTEVSAKLLEDGRLQVIARDITERKQAEIRELQSRIEQEKIALLKQFVGDISHDFRTPFSVMGTSIYLLKKSTDQEKREQHLDKLEVQIAHVQNLFEDQLALLRLDIAETEFHFEVCVLDSLVRGVITQQESLAAQKQHQLTYSPDTERIQLQADKGHLMAALRRIVQNALHYTRDGGQVDIQTRLQSEHAVIEVHDTGIGMSAEEIPLVFDRFYRSNKARGMETGGSGLGLTIARKIIEAHGGAIEVESEVGTGSTFRILLPLNHPQD
jgi:PAS domain S-box-containing protein